MSGTSLRNDLKRRIDSSLFRIKGLSRLREIVALPPETGLNERQWSVLETHLRNAQRKLLDRIKKAVENYYPIEKEIEPEPARRLNEILGQVEFDITKCFTFFDTYMDVLTQRSPSKLGRLLAGCDVLALDALGKNNSALRSIVPPLVYLDRGFGASVLREGVKFPDGTKNPIPLIQIPYTKLRRKYNLTSILHEVGHEAMIRLGLDRELPQRFRKILAESDASEQVIELYALWAYEIGPDFWAFCSAGLAQAAGIKDILALPVKNVFRISFSDPHPSPYLRVLLSFEWCRQIWGRGKWDYWGRDWKQLYPLKKAPGSKRALIIQAGRFLPLIAKCMVREKFKVLKDKTIPDLFDMSGLAPEKLHEIAATACSGKLDFKGISPCTQLAVFRWIREKSNLKERDIDDKMNDWLLMLSKQAYRNKKILEGGKKNDKGRAIESFTGIHLRTESNRL